MSWAMVCSVLQIMGFQQKFSIWIFQCIMMPHFSILLNGNRIPWVKAHCRFREGCPLSPYLFIMYSKRLSMAFKARGSELGIDLANQRTLYAYPWKGAYAYIVKKERYINKSKKRKKKLKIYIAPSILLQNYKKVRRDEVNMLRSPHKICLSGQSNTIVRKPVVLPKHICEDHLMKVRKKTII